MQVRLFRRGRVWWVNYRHRGKRFRRSLRTENKKVAEDLRCDLEYKLRRGEVPGRPRTVAIADFLEGFGVFGVRWFDDRDVPTPLVEALRRECETKRA